MNFIVLGDVLTGDSNGNIFVWGRGYNAVTKVSIIRTITSKSREVNNLCKNKEYRNEEQRFKKGKTEK